LRGILLRSFSTSQKVHRTEEDAGCQQPHEVIVHEYE